MDINIFLKYCQILFLGCCYHFHFHFIEAEIAALIIQEESRSISENVTWGQRKRFTDGKVSLPYKQFLGYDRGESKDDPPVVNPEQAEVVREIYRAFMHGKTPGMIAKQLTAKGIKTPAGKDKWASSTIPICPAETNC